MNINLKGYGQGQRMSVTDILVHVHNSRNNKDAFIDVAGNFYLVGSNFVYHPKNKGYYTNTDEFLVDHFCDVEINELC